MVGSTLHFPGMETPTKWGLGTKRRRRPSQGRNFADGAKGNDSNINARLCAEKIDRIGRRLV